MLLRDTPGLVGGVWAGRWSFPEGRSGKPCKVIRCCRKGRPLLSFVLCTEEHDALASLVVALETEFGCLVGVNAYLTPPGTQGGSCPHETRGPGYDDLQDHPLDGAYILMLSYTVYTKTPLALHWQLMVKIGHEPVCKRRTEDDAACTVWPGFASSSCIVLMLVAATRQ